MMKGISNKFISGILAACMLLNLPQLAVNAQGGVFDSGYKDSTLDSSYKTSAITTVYSTTYKSDLTGVNDWREGMVTGNGENAVIESCNPTNDVLIYQNTKFNNPNSDKMDTPELASVLDDERQALMTLKEGAPWQVIGTQAAKSFGMSTWTCQYDYSFHPGAQMRLNIPATGTVSNYKRWTNYETAEVGVQYSDSKSDNLRRTFASRKDNVVITYITKSPKAGCEQDSTAGKINMTLSIDEISKMQKEGGSIPLVQDKVIVPSDASYIAQVAHYPTLNNSILNNAGYAGVTKVIAVGGTQSKTTLPISDTTRNVGENAGIQISDATSVILITKSDRDVNMGTLADFKETTNYPLVTRLLNDTATAQANYSKNGDFDYDAALQPHAALHSAQFDKVKFNLNGDPADRLLSNEDLLAKQRANPAALNKALLEREYYSGRYADICSSGYSSPRLGGIWTGVWNPNWQSDYTTDANVNLEAAGMNTGNLKEASQGYMNMILRQVKDWQYNAKQVYGIDNAIMAPGRTDGETGFLYHFDAGNPFFAWNAGADWLLTPMYEYWQCYGDQQIPVAENVDVDSLKTVLDLSDTRVQEIKANKAFDLEKDILLPLLTKEANFWKGLMSPNYYEDKDGNPHYDKNHTKLADGETYLILPSFSPENHPAEPYEDVVQINATMDISAVHNGMDMITAMEKAVKGSADPQWQKLKTDVAPYRYHSTGDLEEWALDCYQENYGHRHLSYLYSAWPGYETQTNEKLKEGVETAMAYKNANDNVSNLQSHGWMHKGLVEARLKNGQGVIDSLTPGMTGKVYYSSMMTSHNVNGSSAYCTDTEITTPAIINESLVYSNTGEVQILPALPLDWDKGSISGIMTRTQAQVQDLSWDRTNKTATVKLTSDKDQTVDLKCGINWNDASVSGINGSATVNKGKNISLVMKNGETATVTFTLPSVINGSYAITSGSNYLTDKDQNKTESAAITLNTKESVVPKSALWTVLPVQVDADPKNTWKTPGMYVNLLNSTCKLSIYTFGGLITDATNVISVSKQYPIVDPTTMGQFKITDTGDGDGSVFIQTFQSWADRKKVVPWDNMTQKVFEYNTSTNLVDVTLKKADDIKQKWLMKTDSNGYTTIVSKYNGQYLNAQPLTVTSPTTNTCGSSSDLQNHQIWNITQSGNNLYQISNVNSGRYLAQDNGNAVQKETAQNFKLVSGSSGYNILTEDGTKALSDAGGVLSFTSADMGTEFGLAKQANRNSNYVIDSVQIASPSVIVAGGSADLTPNIYPYFKNTTAVDGAVWSVQNGTGAASISYTGTLTASKEGTVTVTAFSKWAPNITVSKTINIFADKTAIQQLYNNNIHRVSTDYSSSSWQTFQNALKEAEDVINNQSADTNAIQKAISDLNAAVSGLKPNKTALQKLYDDNKNKTQGNYTSGSWQAFQDALKAAETAINDDSADSTAIQKAYNDIQTALSSLTVNSTSNHTSGNSSKNNSSTATTTPANSTTTTTTNAAGGTVATVTTQPDSTPVVSGNQVTLTVTVPADVASGISSATAQKPAEVRISAPTAAILEQLKNTGVKSADLTVNVPTSVANNTNVNAKVFINVDSAILQAAKVAQKNLTLEVIDSATGKQAYSWTFSGAALQNSVTSVTGVNLALSVTSAKNDAVAAIATADNTSARTATGIVLNFSNHGLLPAPAQVRIYVGNQAGGTPFSKLYLYYLNGITKTLEQMPQSQYTVDALGFVTIYISHCSQYVLLPQAATNAYPVKSDTSFAVGIKSSRTYTFAMTVSGKSVPTFTVGNGKAFTGTVKRIGNKYYFTVKAIGTAGTMTAIYSTLPGQKPVVLDYVAVAK